MDNINDELVDAIIACFNENTFPIKYVKLVKITYKNGNQDTITRERFMQLYPKMQNKIMGIMSDEIETLEIKVDRVSIIRHIFEIDNEIQDIVRNRKRKKGQ